MTVERKSPDQIHGFATQAEVERYLDQDLLIRSGMCPNGHGLLEQDACGQTCPVCHFATNEKPELTSQ